MPKGGARIASDKFVVSKAMGFEYFYEVLKYLNDCGDRFFEIDEILVNLNKKFAYWDPARNETCRGTLKELWRLDFINQYDKKNGKINSINENTWNGKSISYGISENGKKVIKDGKELFFINIGKNLLRAKADGIFPQLDKFFYIFKEHGKFPVSDTEHVILSKKYNQYIEKHGGKSIKFGLLETTGIIYRHENYFYLNQDWVSELENLNLDQINFEEDKIELHSNRNYYKSLKIDEELEIKYYVDKKYEINLTFFGSFDKIFNYNVVENNEKQLLLKLTSKIDSSKFTNSMTPSCLGFIELKNNNQISNIKLPNIRITTDDNEWEQLVCDQFEKINFKTIPLSNSDRPDAIIDLSGTINYDDLLEGYIRSDNEKLMMETTINEYSFNKLQKDISKFMRHSEKVLKIDAIGQIIVADWFAKNIEEKFNNIKDNYNHLITLIEMDSLKYLEKFKDKNDFRNKTIKLFKSKSLITKDMIKSTF